MSIPPSPSRSTNHYHELPATSPPSSCCCDCIKKTIDQVSEFLATVSTEIREVFSRTPQIPSTRTISTFAPNPSSVARATYAPLHPAPHNLYTPPPSSQGAPPSLPPSLPPTPPPTPSSFAVTPLQPLSRASSGSVEVLPFSNTVDDQTSEGPFMLPENESPWSRASIP